MPTSYPPSFSKNAISSAIGQIDDFAGSATARSAGRAATAEDQRAFANLASLGDGVPVVITGSRPPLSTNFPGLRETMIGSAIYQLAEQVPADNPLRAKIQELALELHYNGGELIARQRKKARKK